MRWKLTLPLPEFVCRGINYLDAPNILLLCYKTGVTRCISIHRATARRSTAIWTVPSVMDLNSWRAAGTQADLRVGSSSPRLLLLIYRLTPCWKSRVSREKATARGHLNKPTHATASRPIWVFLLFFGASWRTSIALAFRPGGPATAVGILHKGAEKASCCKILPREASCRAERGGWCVWGGTLVPLQPSGTAQGSAPPATVPNRAHSQVTEQSKYS